MAGGGERDDSTVEGDFQCSPLAVPPVAVGEVATKGGAMKSQIGWRQQWCIELVLTKAEARLLAAAIRSKQNGLATAVKNLLAKWGTAAGGE